MNYQENFIILKWKQQSISFMKTNDYININFLYKEQFKTYIRQWNSKDTTILLKQQISEKYDIPANKQTIQLRQPFINYDIIQPYEGIYIHKELFYNLIDFLTVITQMFNQQYPYKNILLQNSRGLLQQNIYEQYFQIKHIQSIKIPYMETEINQNFNNISNYLGQPRDGEILFNTQNNNLLPSPNICDKYQNSPMKCHLFQFKDYDQFNLLRKNNTFNQQQTQYVSFSMDHLEINEYYGNPLELYGQNIIPQNSSFINNLQILLDVQEKKMLQLIYQ